MTTAQRERLKERDRLGKEATRLRSEGKLAEAIVAAEGMLAIERAVLGEASEDAIGSLEGIAEIREQRRDWPAAIRTRREVLALRVRALGEGHWKSADARWALARAEAVGRLDERGRRRFAEAEEIGGELGALFAQGRYREAIPKAERASALLREVLGERQPYAIRALNNLAVVLRLQGDYAAARPLAERVLALDREILGEQHPETLMAMGNLAALLWTEGDFETARRLLEKGLAPCRRVLGERHSITLTTVQYLAMVLQDQGDYAAARPLLEEVLARHRESLGDRDPEVAADLNNLATLFFDQREYAAARPLFEKALARYRESLGERHPATLSAMGNLATLLRERGDYAAARPLAERAWELAREVRGERHPETLVAMGNLAALMQAQGDYAAARPLAEKVLAWHRESLGGRHPHTLISMDHLARLLHQLGQERGALELAGRALSESESSLGATLPTLAEREQIALIRSSRAHLELYLDLTGANPAPVASAYARVLAVKGFASDAARARRIAAGSSPRVLAAPAEIPALRNRLGQLYQAPVPQDRAAEHARRVRELVDEIARKEAEVARAIGWKPEMPTPEELAAALPVNTPLIDLVRYRHDGIHAPGTPRPPSEPRYAAFIVRNARPVRRIELGPAAPIDRALGDLRARAQEDGGDPDAPGRELARLVWAPLEPHLDGCETVLLAPDGDLNFLPWAALPDPRAPGRYLVERYALAAIGSGRQLLAQLRRPALAGPPTLLAAGAVDYDRGDFGAPTATPRGPAAPPASPVAGRVGRAPASGAHYAPLPATGPETNAVADAFRRARHGRAEIIEGTKATKDAIRRALPGHRYLHLATHGYFAPPSVKSAASPDPERLTAETAGRLGRSEIEGFYPGLLSGLAWAGANHPPADPATGLADLGAGTMTAEEVGALDLSACELAVLSACETGLGRTAGGEGVLGLQRAFHQAGCRTVVASLWKVDDAATAALMGRFYGHLWGGKLSAIEALRRAQLDMLEGRLPVGGAGRGIGEPQPADPKASRVGRRVHPRFWAAWTVSGPPTAVGARSAHRPARGSVDLPDVGGNALPREVPVHPQGPVVAHRGRRDPMTIRVQLVVHHVGREVRRGGDLQRGRRGRPAGGLVRPGGVTRNREADQAQERREQ